MTSVRVRWDSNTQIRPSKMLPANFSSCKNSLVRHPTVQWKLLDYKTSHLSGDQGKPRLFAVHHRELYEKNPSYNIGIKPWNKDPVIKQPGFNGRYVFVAHSVIVISHDNQGHRLWSGGFSATWGSLILTKLTGSDNMCMYTYVYIYMYVVVWTHYIDYTISYSYSRLLMFWLL